MPLGSPSYSAKTSKLPFLSMRKILPNARSTTYRLPARSNDGPSRKQPAGVGLLPAAMRSALEPLLRRFAGTSANTSVSMRCGGGKSDILSSLRGNACLLHHLRPLLRLVGDEAA